METIKIKLQRSQLIDDFIVSNQTLETGCVIDTYFLKDLENSVTKVCKDLECFTVYAIVIVQPIRVICDKRITKATKLVVKEMQTYDGANVLSKVIDLSKY